MLSFFKKSANKIYVFEDINIWLLPIFIWALARGYPIHVFELSARFRRYKVVQKAIRENKITNAYVFAAPGVGRYALKTADKLVEETKDQGLVKLTCDLYEDKEAVRIFKKSLMVLIFNARFMVFYLNRLKAEHEGAKISFFTTDFTPVVNYLKCYDLLGDDMALSKSYKIWPSYFYRLSKYVIQSARLLCVYSVSLFLISLQVLNSKFKPRQTPKENFPLLWSINSKWHTNFKGGRSYDFIIDDDVIKQKDVLFFIETDLEEPFVKAERQKGRQFFKPTRNRVNKELLSNNIIDQNAFLAFKVILRGFLFFGRDTETFSVFSSAVSQYLHTHTILSCIGFDKYVYTNNESPNQIAIDILLTQNKVGVYRHQIFIGGPYLFYKEDGAFDDIYHEFAFINTANWFMPNDGVTNSYKKHYQSVGNYHVIGNYFAQLINDIGNQKNQRHLVSKYFKDRTDQPVVTIFDTTYINSPDCQTSMEDGIGFLKDLIEVAKALPEVSFVFKPSKPDAFFVNLAYQFSASKSGKMIVDLRKDLGELDNVIVETREADPTNLISFSEVIVTHCFSSPTADALAASKKAIWYEPYSKNTGTVMDNIEGLVVRGANNLEGRLRSLIFEETFEEFKRDKIQKMEEMIDPYMDGMALTRMRHLLSQQ